MNVLPERQRLACVRSDVAQRGGPANSSRGLPSTRIAGRRDVVREPAHVEPVGERVH